MRRALGLSYPRSGSCVLLEGSVLWGQFGNSLIPGSGVRVGVGRGSPKPIPGSARYGKGTGFMGLSDKRTSYKGLIGKRIGRANIYTVGVRRSEMKGIWR